MTSYLFCLAPLQCIDVQQLDFHCQHSAISRIEYRLRESYCFSRLSNCSFTIWKKWRKEQQLNNAWFNAFTLNMADKIRQQYPATSVDWYSWVDIKCMLIAHQNQKIHRKLDELWIQPRLWHRLWAFFLVISRTNWRCVKAYHTNQLIEFGLVMLFCKYSLVYAFNNNLAIFHCPLKTFVIWFCRRWSSTNGTVSVQNPYIFRFYNQQNELKTHDFIHQKKNGKKNDKDDSANATPHEMKIRLRFYCLCKSMCVFFALFLFLKISVLCVCLFVYCSTYLYFVRSKVHLAF